jgi:hypothetical protein
MTPLTGRQIAMQRLLEVCKYSKVAAIDRARLFLERASEVRGGCREQRTESRALQGNASKRKAAKLDKPLGW